MTEPKGLILVVAGLFPIICAALDFEWFMGARKAQALVNLIGRNGARLFYIILGLIIGGIGLMITFGVVGSGQ